MGVVRSVVAFGDDIGLPMLLKYLPRDVLAGLVCADIRPHQHGALRDLAKGAGVPLLIQPRRASSAYASFAGTLGKLNPDLIIVNSYSMLLHPDVLDIPKLGCINVHAALLPEYRGASIVPWAILNRETETGATIHYMTEAFDAGDVIAQRGVPLYFEDTWREVLDRTLNAADSLIADQLPAILSGDNKRTPQDETRAHHHRRRKPEDGDIPWDTRVLDIYNHIRALVAPYPGVLLKGGSHTLRILQYMTVPQIVRLKLGVGAETLSGPRTRISPIQVRHVHLFLGSLSAADTWELGLQTDATDAWAWLKSTLQDNRAVHLAGRGTADRALRFFASLYSYDPYRKTVWLMLRAVKGVGLCYEELREAAQLTTSLAMRELDARCVACWVDPEDDVMTEALSANGFERLDCAELQQAGRIRWATKVQVS
jgi:methionyl-tRNA formyltransferase